jgi:hypothetical protein
MHPLITAAAKAAAELNPLTNFMMKAAEEYAQIAHEESIRLAVEAIDNRVAKLQDRVSVDAVRRDEFVDLLKSWAATVQRTQYEEKLTAAGNVLANAMLRDGDHEKLTYSELDHFTRCLEQLSLKAIHVLHAIINRANLGRRPAETHRRNVRFEFVRLREDLNGIDPDLLMGLLGELNSFGLIFLPSEPGVSMGQEGERKYHNHAIESTPLGYRFKAYILDPGRTAETTQAGA